MAAVTRAAAQWAAAVIRAAAVTAAPAARGSGGGSGGAWHGGGSSGAWHGGTGGHAWYGGGYGGWHGGYGYGYRGWYGAPYYGYGYGLGAGCRATRVLTLVLRRITARRIRTRIPTAMRTRAAVYTAPGGAYDPGPTNYVQRDPGYRYYCRDPAGFYPDVSELQHADG